MAKHKHADLIKAWAEGAEIEYLSEFSTSWISTLNPAWYEDKEYRIKPEPIPDKIYVQNHSEYSPEGVWCGPGKDGSCQQVKWTIDGETGRIKSVELLDFYANI